MLSKFGATIRKIRNKENESLRKMASRLEISPSLLSAMEVGRRKITNEVLEKIKTIYHLTEEEFNELEIASCETNNIVSIELDLMSQEQRDLSITFSRKIQNADPELLKKLKELLDENQN